MAAVALIKFTQGASVGTPGEVLVGTVGTLVLIENNINTDVASWQIDLVYTPPDSAVPVAVPLTFHNNSSVPSGTFTPDFEGPYRVVLKVWEVINRVGTPKDTDIRVFWVPEVKHGFFIPPYQKDPDPRKTLASGDPTAKPNELNIDGQELGWDGGDSPGLLHDILRQLDASNFDLLPDPPADGPFVIVSADRGTEPIGVVYDATDQELWLCDKSGPRINRLDVSTGTPVKVATIYMTSYATQGRKIRTDATHAFVANLTDSVVTIISKSTNAVVGILDAGAGRQARAVEVNGDDIYVVSKGGPTGQIRKYSKAAALAGFPTPQAATLTLTNPTPGFTFEELAIGGGKLWATSNFDQEVHKVNLTTLVHEGSYLLAEDTAGVVYAFGSVWVATSVFGNVHRFNPGTFPAAPIASIALAGAFGAKGITADGTYVYVSDNFGAARVWRVDPGSNTVTATMTNIGDVYADLASDGTYLWVVNQLLTALRGLRRVTLASFTLTASWFGIPSLDYQNAAGDVTGAFNSTLVSKIQGTLVSGTAPVTAKSFRFNGLFWIPANEHTEVSLLAGVASTSLLGYQTIGAVYFNPATLPIPLAAFSTLRFEVLIETTNVADSADIRLWNVTDSVSVTTLTSTSLTPDYKSASLVVGVGIPSAAKAYELQLKMGAGVAPDRVTCKMGKFILYV